MTELKGHERKYLRGLAHGLKPVVQIGIKGITEGLILAINEALDTHELIKIKFIDMKEMKKELSDEIAAKTCSELCGIIGNIAILYKRQRDPEKRKISLKNAGAEG